MPRPTSVSSIPLLLRMILVLIWCLVLSSDQDAEKAVEPKMEGHKGLWKDPLWMKAALAGTNSIGSSKRETRTTILNEGQYIWIGSNPKELQRVMHSFIEGQRYGFHANGELKAFFESKDRKHYLMDDLMFGLQQKGRIITIGGNDNQNNPEFYGIVNYNGRMRPYKFKLPDTEKEATQWLYSAIEYDDAHTALKILALDIFKRNDEKNALLISTICQLGAIKVLKELLKRSIISVHSTDSLGNTPLHKAAISGNIDLIHLLLEHGARTQLTKSNHKGTLPVTFAKVFDNPDAAKLLKAETKKYALIFAASGLKKAEKPIPSPLTHKDAHA